MHILQRGNIKKAIKAMTKIEAQAMAGGIQRIRRGKAVVSIKRYRNQTSVANKKRVIIR